MDIADCQINSPQNSSFKPYKIVELVYKEDDVNFVAKPGEMEVKKIEQHTPKGRGDRFYCDIIHKNGQVKRVFNIESIEYKPIEIEKEVPPWEKEANNEKN